MIRWLGNLLNDVRGATAIEYGLIISLVVIALVVGVQSLANQTSGLWGGVANKVVNAS